MTALLMIKGKTYACPPVLGKNTIVVPGQTVEVPADKVELLLGESYMDPSNNEHFYFVEADSAEAKAFLKRRKAALPAAEADDEDEEEGAAGKTKAARKPRARSAG